MYTARWPFTVYLRTTSVDCYRFFLRSMAFLLFFSFLVSNLFLFLVIFSSSLTSFPLTDGLFLGKSDSSSSFSFHFLFSIFSFYALG